MKVKIKDIHPNPYKKWINKGELNQDQIEKLKASLGELGHMGSIPCVKIKGKIHQVSHHHRLEALRQLYGEDYEVEIEIEDYNDEQIMRAQVLENLTQRKGDFREEAENCIAISKYLKENKILLDENGNEINRSDSERMKSKRDDGRGGKVDEYGSLRQIERWLNKYSSKNKEILTFVRISEVVKLKTLPKDLYDSIEMTHKGSIERRGDSLGKTQALYLTTLDDPDEQRDIAVALLNSFEGRVRQQSTLIKIYKEAPDEVKQKIRSGEINIADVKRAQIEYEISLHQDPSERIFIPNFPTKMTHFSRNITSLESQISDLKIIMENEKFKYQYKMLSKAQKKIFDDGISFLENRIKKCYNNMKKLTKELEQEKIKEEED